MQELSVPVVRPVKPGDNVTDDVFANAEDWPDAAGLKRKVNGTWISVTWREFAGQVRGLAAGLIAVGIQSGDRVALMSRTRFEWTLVDYAILTAGGVTVPVYPTSSLEQVEWILGDSGAVAVVTETDDHAGKVAAARPGLPALAHVWQIDGSRFGGLPDLTARGAQVTAEQVEDGAGPAGRATWPRSSTPPARPAVRRAACSATATSSPMRATAWKTTASSKYSASTPRRCCSCRWRTATPSSSSTAPSTLARSWAWPTWRTP